MKNEVRFGHEVVSDATEKDNQSAKANADFLSLAEEVRAPKPKTENHTASDTAKTRACRI
jgi:hypothetical protein